MRNRTVEKLNEEYFALQRKPSTEEVVRRRRELTRQILELKSKGKLNDDFQSGHFDEPNILAHVRFNEREVNGERVLFIEEIQSDWAQKGKKKGFNDR